MRMTNRIRRLCRLRVLSCYLLLVVICLWLVLYLYGLVCTTSNPVKSSLLACSRCLFKERPLIVLTLSYHAAPIFDLMDQLKPLGVQFIERGIDAYACQYFNTCRHHDPLKVIHSRNVHQFLSYIDVEEFYAYYHRHPDWQSVDAFICLHPAATCELFLPFNRTIIILATIRYDNGRAKVSNWKRWNAHLLQIAADSRNVIAANNQYDVQYMQYYTGLTPRLLPSRCSYTQATYNPTRRAYLLGLRRDWQFRDFFIDAINSACKALNVSVQLVSIRDLYPTYRWKDLAAHRAIVPLPCQPSMIGIIEQYRMNIPLFLPSKSLLEEWQTGAKTMMNDIYSHFPSDILPPHPSQQHIPDPNIRNSTHSIHYWTQLSDWYTTLPHIILYVSFEDLVLRLNRTTLDELRRVSRLMAQHNARVAHQLHDDWQEILLKVASNSPNHPR